MVLILDIILNLCFEIRLHLTCLLYIVSLELGTLSSIGGNGGNNVFGVIRSIVPFRLTGSTKGDLKY